MNQFIYSIFSSPQLNALFYNQTIIQLIYQLMYSTFCLSKLQQLNKSFTINTDDNSNHIKFKFYTICLIVKKLQHYLIFEFTQTDNYLCNRQNLKYSATSKFNLVHQENENMKSIPCCRN